MKIELINDIGQIKKEWEELVLKSKTATIFQTFDWAQIWFKYFPQGKPHILTVWDNDLLAIAPFLQNESGFYFWGTPEVLGGELVTDYGDIIIHEGQEG